MQIENIPEIYQQENSQNKDLFIYDYKMTEDVVKSKVQLSMNMFSFLQVGKKQVHFADATAMVSKDQSLLIRQGNWLWTELLDNDDIYFCKLFFFSEQILLDYLKKYELKEPEAKEETSFFIIENDEYITSFLSTLSNISQIPDKFSSQMLSIKFEEILTYLLTKYGADFEKYLYSLISKEISPFKKTVESNAYSNLKLEEFAFLCNMSLSSFKRRFLREFGESPGKWLQDKRLQRAHDILQEGDLTASDIYLDFGYGNLSNFSAAFKNKFGINPTELQKS
ncbi:helix-turn-helix domain-containing protein [Plebeiibacterium sediminum]|uniref:AraC family transcriptional regulator n=1 Tax=Plebeiibacterium sediminum TaxID=2992112 RepID=A0AAE3M6D2_9BACT|nr:AraC family transcriptional regulator [Plebeiobacterium sediminum]MCW3787806.1 AraC family transcriptional regulator [Plebeiobacterium sediminum]